MKLLIENGTLIRPGHAEPEQANLFIRDGKISDIVSSDQATELKRESDVKVIEAKGLMVCPGLIDMHVHLREPGEEYKETIKTGTRAAAAGGFAAVACMPNTSPHNDNAAVTSYILKKAEEASSCRVYPIACISKGSKGESLTEFFELQEAGAIGFSDDGKPVINGNLMRHALEYATALVSKPRTASSLKVK